MDEKINSKTHEQKPESPNSGSSSKVSQDVKSKSEYIESSKSAEKGAFDGSSKSVRVRLFDETTHKVNNKGAFGLGRSTQGVRLVNSGGVWGNKETNKDAFGLAAAPHGVLGLPSLVYSKDKPCSACEKGKHKRASFKTKQNFSIRKCLHLLHMDLFGPVSLMSINHKKYTLVIVDEYSRNFSELLFSLSPEQNGVAKRMNKTLIEAARTMLNGSVLSKHFWTEADTLMSQQISESLTQEDNNLRRLIMLHLMRVWKPSVITLNEPGIPHIEDAKGPPDRINTEGNYEQNVQDEKILTYSTEGLSGNNTEVLVSVIKSLVTHVPQSQISNQASTSSHSGPHDKWLKDQHIELVNIIGNPGEGMLIRSMDAKLTTVSASECLFADFLFKMEPKKVFEALKHPGWVDAMQEELNQFHRKKAWTLVPLLYGKIAICSKWEEGIDYDETFAPVARMEAIRIFIAFVTYMNFIVFQIDVKSAFLNGKLKEEVYVKQPPGFESSEFPDYVCKLDKALYGLKQAPRACSSVKTPMVPLNNLGPDLAGKSVNETLYRGMIGSLMYLTATRPDIQFSTVLCARYQSNPKESHLIAMKESSVAMSSADTEYVVAAGYCASILWMKSQLSDYDIHYKMVPIFCDNTSAIAISNNPILHSRTKHINIRYHFIRDHILKGDIELHSIPTEYQSADILTKPLDEPTFTRLKAESSMLNID
ncbi:retrovirus-related pol polyprotein from transposon TNT 1-94 [Tanacetum coccineum]